MMPHDHHHNPYEDRSHAGISYQQMMGVNDASVLLTDSMMSDLSLNGNDNGAAGAGGVIGNGGDFDAHLMPEGLFCFLIIFY